MIIEKIAIYALIALTTVIVTVIGILLFGTLKFLQTLNKMQKKLIALNNQIVGVTQEAIALQNDLTRQRQWLLHNKCNCMRQSEANIPDEKH